jgi:hypothetical protein
MTMSKRLRMSGQRWAGVMRDVDPNGGSGGGGGQQQGQQGGQGQGQLQQGQGQGGAGSGGGGSGTGDDFWNLNGGQQNGNGQQGQQQNGQQQGQQNGGQQQGQPITMADLQAFGATIATQMQSEFDRRVNQIVNGTRGRGGQGGQQGGGQNGGQQGNGQQGGQQQQGQQQQGAPGFNPSDVDRREARMAFRDFVGEGFTFIDAGERGLATTIGAQLLAQQQEIGDPDLIGRQLAVEVQNQMRAIRETYRKAVIASLKATGQYVEKPGGGQQGNGSSSAPANLMPSFANPGSGQNKFEAAAKAAAQFNEANGHSAPAKATT